MARQPVDRHAWAMPSLADLAAEHPLAAAPHLRGRSLGRLLDLDPDLGARMDPGAFELARRELIVVWALLEPGRWAPRLAPQAREGLLGLLVVDGLLVKTGGVAGLGGAELVGAGDLLRPWDEDGEDGFLDETARWDVLARTRLAVLDARTAAGVGRWPSLGTALMRRSAQRSRAAAVRLALVQVRRADARLRILFWHLAERWGRVCPDGVVLPLPLTHRLIAQLACLRRPSVSTALGYLARRGEVVRRPDGSWLLAGDPPEPGTLESDDCAVAEPAAAA
jgi:CRP/FNR family cyclic AMP-dependent transcriptional regulator